MSEINKKELEHLAELARIKLSAGEESKLMKDLEQILEYFNELKQANTKNIHGMVGGTELTSVMREDSERESTLPPDIAKEAFPESEDGYLKVPPVFE